jgi:hypothetical protein
MAMGSSGLGTVLEAHRPHQIHLLEALQFTEEGAELDNVWHAGVRTLGVLPAAQAAKGPSGLPGRGVDGDERGGRVRPQQRLRGREPTRDGREEAAHKGIRRRDLLDTEFGSREH